MDSADLVERIVNHYLDRETFYWILGTAVVIIGLLVGGFTTWLRKLDDRQFNLVAQVVTKDDLHSFEKRILEAVRELRNRLNSRQ